LTAGFADRLGRILYNYFRDYSPEIGRYIQSDPIGLRGGLNTYTYVKNDPLKKRDTFGLFTDPFVDLEGQLPAHDASTGQIYDNPNNAPEWEATASEIGSALWKDCRVRCVAQALAGQVAGALPQSRIQKGLQTVATKGTTEASKIVGGCAYKIVRAWAVGTTTLAAGGGLMCLMECKICGGQCD
jgi:RHS repeat-associated protein